MRLTTWSRTTSAAIATAMTGALLATAPAATGTSAEASSPAAPTLTGARGLDVAPGGRVVVAQADGRYGVLVRKGEHKGRFRKLGEVGPGFIAPALDVNDAGAVFVLTTGGEGRAAYSLYRWTRRDGQVKIARVRGYQREDTDPYDLEDKPGESNPYGVAALGDGSALVADAANNDLLRVRPNGKIYTVARFKPRMVEVPEGLGPDAPPAGTVMPSESVPTSVTVGADGAMYVGELRGFPATPGTSQVWRIRPGARNAVCDPEKPNKGPCRLHADGFTSIVALQAGRGGSLYVTELSKLGWLMMEDPNAGPEAMIGSVIRVGHDTDVRRELGAGKVIAPGDVAVRPGGAVLVSTPIFGPSKVMRLN